MAMWSFRGRSGRCGRFGAADEDYDGFVMVVASERVVNEGDVELEFGGVFGLELAGSVL